MLLAMLAVAAILSARELTGGAALVAAIATKLSAAFLAPFALLGTSRRRDERRGRNRPVGGCCRGGWRGAGDRGRRLPRLRLGLAARLRARGREPEPDQPHEHPDHLRAPHRPRPRRRPPRRRDPLRRPRRLPARLDLARRRLGPRRRLGRLRPPPRHRLAPPLVPDLAAAAGGHLPRPPPAAPDPRPDGLPAGSPHPASELHQLGACARRPPVPPLPPPARDAGCRCGCSSPRAAPAPSPPPT